MKPFKFLLTLFAIAMTAATASAASPKRITATGETETRTYNVGNIHALSVLGAFDVVLDNNRAEVELKAPANMFDYIVFTNNKGALTVKFKPNISVNVDANSIVLYLPAAGINNIALSGSGRITASDLVADGDFKISLRGSGDIDIASLRSEGETSVTLSGSGDINVGTIVAGEVSAMLKGSGDLEIKSIDAANKSTIALAGSGDLEVVSSVRAPIISSSLTGSGDLKVNTAIGNEVEMALNGSGDAYAKTIEAYKCTVTLNGTGDASVKTVKADVITATSTGSCTLSLGGSVRKATYKSSGSAELKASHLLAREVTATCDKKSEIQLNASESLKCTVNGDATLKYTGSPRLTSSGNLPIPL